jgi:hypothetical protein
MSVAASVLDEFCNGNQYKPLFATGKSKEM